MRAMIFPPNTKKTTQFCFEKYYINLSQPYRECNSSGEKLSRNFP
ncbi:hypothetical protein EMIT0210MI2_13855 [Priestia megaterium]